jgi:hypothetical protein
MNIGELIQSKRGCRGNAALPRDGIMLSIFNRKATTPDGEDKRQQLAIGIGAGAMALSRWCVGDRVTIDIDPTTSTATIRRVVNGEAVPSWKLTDRQGSKGKQRIGESVASTVKFTTSEKALVALGMEDAGGPYVPGDIIIGGHGIRFPLRKQFAVNVGGLGL